MTQRCKIDGHEHFACEQCGTWTRVEFCELVEFVAGEREMCPVCVAEVERELRDEARASEQRGPLHAVEGWR